MPCRMDDMPDMSQQDTINALKKEGDKATARLCTVLKLIEGEPALFKELPKDIQKWWKHHSKKDERREAKELLKKQMSAIED